MKIYELCPSGYPDSVSSVWVIADSEEEARAISIDHLKEEGFDMIKTFDAFMDKTRVKVDVVRNVEKSVVTVDYIEDW